MKVRINGMERELPEGATVAEALLACGAPESGVAVAVDGAVVPKARWAEVVLRPTNTVELLTAVQGG
ncbi:sulfur carrier protein ThiS [Actinoalloteichus hymeniacidonis]|uniref:Thiamine biosynthesis protein ThiS n=1 Tax=Actinoalloteichus hymeniacidonis TaxID=340345 RepID=A0AAC9HL99_9PSEU|nr:sulfur carrier protein ThiS [Actinoalloteichus hymeniacidonis]AOS61254.1 thiamine biosynthesis protein ThiS [Actinoalloteichus hymeniacidonis]MBB5910743.1 sulfur carrier protein [Actinoalloteichus hymeniacidonis]